MTLSPLGVGKNRLARPVRRSSLSKRQRHSYAKYTQTVASHRKSCTWFGATPTCNATAWGFLRPVKPFFVTLSIDSSSIKAPSPPESGHMSESVLLLRVAVLAFQTLDVFDSDEAMDAAAAVIREGKA